MNTIRHAGAETALITLACPADAVEITVTDGGRGLGGAEEGRGRSGMRERAELMGATLEWFMPEGGGTGVRLRLARRVEGTR